MYPSATSVLIAKEHGISQWSQVKQQQNHKNFLTQKQMQIYAAHKMENIILTPMK